MIERPHREYLAKHVDGSKEARIALAIVEAIDNLAESMTAAILAPPVENLAEFLTPSPEQPATIGSDE